MNLSVQFQTLFAMILMGVLFGATLDTYKRFVNRYKRNIYIVVINDFIFGCVHALLLFYVLYRVNYGEVRFYLFLAILCGFSFYQVFITVLYKKILEAMITLVRNFFIFLYKIVWALLIRPIQIFLYFIFRFVIFIAKAVLGLVKSLGIMVIWLIQIIFYPMFAIVNFFWKLLPKRFQEKGIFIANKWINCKQKVTEWIRNGVALMQSAFRSFK